MSRKYWLIRYYYNQDQPRVLNLSGAARASAKTSKQAHELVRRVLVGHYGAMPLSITTERAVCYKPSLYY